MMHGEDFRPFRVCINDDQPHLVEKWSSEVEVESLPWLLRVDPRV